MLLPLVYLFICGVHTWYNHYLCQFSCVVTFGPCVFCWWIVVILGDLVCALFCWTVLILGNVVWTLWLFGTFLAYCCVFVQCGCGWFFCANPRRLRWFLLHHRSFYQDFLLHLWILVLFFSPEHLGGRVEDSIQFVELFDFTFVHTCH